MTSLADILGLPDPSPSPAAYLTAPAPQPDYLPAYAMAPEPEPVPVLTPKEKKVQDLFKRFDTDNSGDFDWTEWRHQVKANTPSRIGRGQWPYIKRAFLKTAGTDDLIQPDELTVMLI